MHQRGTEPAAGVTRPGVSEGDEPWPGRDTPDVRHKRHSTPPSPHISRVKSRRAVSLHVPHGGLGIQYRRIRHNYDSTCRRTYPRPSALTRADAHSTPRKHDLWRRTQGLPHCRYRRTLRTTKPCEPKAPTVGVGVCAIGSTQHTPDAWHKRQNTAVTTHLTRNTSHDVTRQVAAQCPTGAPRTPHA